MTYEETVWQLLRDHVTGNELPAIIAIGPRPMNGEPFAVTFPDGARLNVLLLPAMTVEEPPPYDPTIAAAAIVKRSTGDQPALQG